MCRRNTPNGTEMCAFEADEFLAMLSEFSGMGAAMRRVLTSALISTEVCFVNRSFKICIESTVPRISSIPKN